MMRAGLVTLLSAMSVLTAEAQLRPDPAMARTWWAFQPLMDSAPSAASDHAPATTALDALIVARLPGASPRLAPPADHRTLIRRACFDLTGLPPTAEEVEAFAAEAAPDAFARLVDRLLASPHYGEQWGRHWLDVVRYADTAGETADYPVPVAWRYRNYVINAFNGDKPYDDFLREQIAGDILAARGPRDRYAERVTATGYLAISRRFGFDSENYHHLTIQDTIDTLGQSVLGLSFGCARCHDHMFDPITMADYYALYGIFESTRYAFPGSEQKQNHRALAPMQPPSESRPAWRAFEARTAVLSRTLELAGQPVPTAVLRSLDDIDGDFELQAPAAGGSNGVLVPPWTYEGPIAVTAEAQSPLQNLHPLGRVGASVPGGSRRYRITQALTPRRTREAQEEVLHINLDFRVAAEAGPVEGHHRFWLGPATGAPALEVLIHASHISLRTGETERSLRTLRANDWYNLQLSLDLRRGTVTGLIGRPDDVVGFETQPLAAAWQGILDHLGFDSGEAAEAALPAIAWDNLGVQDGGRLDPVADLRKQLAAQTASAATARDELERLLVDGPFELAYATSEGTPVDSRLQMRGEPDKPGAAIPRGLPGILGGGPLPKGTAGSGRLELAAWLVGPAQALTARVMVNRLWQWHFGHGLVRTPNDFGARGLRPDNPELLDFLASKFIRSGWSIKSIHRLIMGSAAYQQAIPPQLATDAPAGAGHADAIAASVPPPVDAAAPAGSLVHVARRRLSAEEIRDSILLASGVLDPTPGEGHPFPSPLSWGFTQHSPYTAVYDHRRRSVYLMTQRIKRHPFLALFDGPDPNASTAERHTTTVPTQALYFLNDAFVHASSEALADRVLAAAGHEEGWINSAYRFALGRHPTSTEHASATAFLSAYRAELAATGLDSSPRPALAAFARVLFGSNEFLTVD